MRPALLLLLLAMFAHLPQLRYPEWRGTEARRVRIAIEMVESGDYIVPRLWGAATYTKPPFYYWCLALSIKLFGLSQASMRLPSVLAFWLLAWLGYCVLRRWQDHVAACLGAAAVLLAPAVLYDVPFAEIDPVFAALTAASVLLLADGRLCFAGVLGGLALLSKGPPYLLFVIGPLWLWWRQQRLAGLLRFLPGLLIPPALYYFALYLTGPAQDVAGVAGQESVGRLFDWRLKALYSIPEYLLRAFFLISLPFTFWLWPWFLEKRRSQDACDLRFNYLVYAAVFSVLALLFFPYRSSRYLLPAIGLLLLGLAPLVARSYRCSGPPPPVVQRLLSVLGMIFAAGLVALPWLPFPYPGRTVLTALALAALPAFLPSQRRLVLFALAVPLLAAYSAIPDRVEYFRTAPDFAPPAAKVLARELRTRGIEEIRTCGNVSTSLLLHSGLGVDGDPEFRRPPNQRWVLTQDRGVDKGRATDILEVPGYVDRVRIQMGKKSIALKERVP